MRKKKSNHFGNNLTMKMYFDTDATHAPNWLFYSTCFFFLWNINPAARLCIFLFGCLLWFVCFVVCFLFKLIWKLFFDIRLTEWYEQTSKKFIFLTKKSIAFEISNTFKIIMSMENVSTKFICAKFLRHLNHTNELKWSVWRCLTEA